MHYSQIKIATEAMCDEIRQAAKGTPYEYHVPMVILTVSRLGINVSIVLGLTEYRAERLQSFDEAMIEAQVITRRLIAQLDPGNLARTLGVEMAHA